MTKKLIVFLVLLRITIGWHFLYEGLWKFDQDNIVEPMTTSRYGLYNAVTGLRNYFTSAVSDPAGADKLTVQAASARLDQFQDEVGRAAGSLGEPQRVALAELRAKVGESVNALVGSPTFQVRLAEFRADAKQGHADAAEEAALKRTIEAAVSVDPFSLREQVLQLPEEKPNHFTSQAYLQQSNSPFRWFFRALIKDASGLDRLNEQHAQAAIDARYRQVVDHFRSAGHPLTDEQQKKLAAERDKQKQWMTALFHDPEFQARLNDYKEMLQRVKQDSGRVTAAFGRERLLSDRTRLDKMSAEMLGYVNEPLVDISLQARNMATAEQMRAGTAPRLDDPTEFVDTVVKYGLVLMGLCMLLGLFTPVALAGAALQLLMFYLATPPWPGLPAAPGEGHFMYVDRTLIEFVAVLVLLAANTGRYGLDALFEKYVLTRVRARKAGAPEAEVAATKASA